jgi:hypothetical protein
MSEFMEFHESFSLTGIKISGLFNKNKQKIVHNGQNGVWYESVSVKLKKEEGSFGLFISIGKQCIHDASWRLWPLEEFGLVHNYFWQQLSHFEWY